MSIFNWLQVESQWSCKYFQMVWVLTVVVCLTSTCERILNACSVIVCNKSPALWKFSSHLSCAFTLYFQLMDAALLRTEQSSSLQHCPWNFAGKCLFMVITHSKQNFWNLFIFIQNFSLDVLLSIKIQFSWDIFKVDESFIIWLRGVSRETQINVIIPWLLCKYTGSSIWLLLTFYTYFKVMFPCSILFNSILMPL